MWWGWVRVVGAWLAAESGAELSIFVRSMGYSNPTSYTNEIIVVL